MRILGRWAPIAAALLVVALVANGFEPLHVRQVLLGVSRGALHPVDELILELSSAIPKLTLAGRRE